MWSIYINENLEYKARNDLKLNVKYCEDIWTEIAINKTPGIFAVIYRHPSHSFDKYQDLLLKPLVKIENKKKIYYIAGNQIIDIIRYSSGKPIRSYIDAFTQYQLYVTN